MSARSPRYSVAALAVAGAALLVSAPTTAAQAGTDAGEAVALGTGGSLRPAGHDLRASRSRRSPAAERRIAVSLRHAARRLYDDPERWSDVAVFHAHAAALSGLEGREAASDLILAANLLWREGERRYACAALRTAGRVALRAGDVRRADAAFRQATRAGSTDCARHLNALLERIVPAPLAVHVDPPPLRVEGLEEAKIRPDLRRPRLARPALGTWIVDIPSPSDQVEVAPPSLRFRIPREAVIRPVVRRATVLAPSLPGRSKGER